MIDVAALRAAIETRKALAEAARGDSDGQWFVTDPDDGRVVDSAGITIVYDEGAPSFAEAQHMAANSPAAVLRRCARDLRVLERHHPDNVEPICCIACSWDVGDAMHYEPWPCVELCDLAEDYGLSNVHI